MAHKDQNPEEPESVPTSGAPESGAPEAAATDPGSADSANTESAKVDAAAPTAATEADGFEGPDVETSLSDADLSFLSGQSSAEDLAAQHLGDLKRVTAEYANYRKRTEANAVAERERAMGEAVKMLLPVLDDLDRAEKHGDLGEDSPFLTIASKLRASVERLGLTPFGKQGDLFDPNVHEAIFQQPSPDVEADTVGDVVETGYYLGSHMLRVAKVVVQTPA